MSAGTDTPEAMRQRAVAAMGVVTPEQVQRMRSNPCSLCGGDGCIACTIRLYVGIWPDDKPLPKGRAWPERETAHVPSTANSGTGTG